MADLRVLEIMLFLANQNTQDVLNNGISSLSHDRDIKCTFITWNQVTGYLIMAVSLIVQSILVRRLQITFNDFGADWPFVLFRT